MQSLAIKPRLSQVRNSREGTCSQCSIPNTSLRCIRRRLYWVVCSLQDSGSFKTQHLRWRSQQTIC